MLSRPMLCVAALALGLGLGAKAVAAPQDGSAEVIGADYGVRCDGTTDDAAAIRSALAATRSGYHHRLVLPHGDCAIGSTIATDDWSNIDVEGAGAGDFGAPGTSLRWIGSPGGVMVDWHSAGGVGITTHSALRGLVLDGNGRAGTGLRARGLSQSNLDMMIQKVTRVGADFDIDTNDPSPENPRDFSRNVVERLYVDLQDPASANAKGLVLGPGSRYLDNNSSIFREVVIAHRNGTGLECGNADSNLFVFLRIDRFKGGTGAGMTLGAGTTPHLLQSCRANTFLVAQTIGGTLAQAGTAGDPSFDNVIYSYLYQSGAPAPVIEKGATLRFVSDTGSSVGWHDLGVGTTQPARTVEIANAQDVQLRLGFGTENPSYTYDIGRNDRDGFMHLHGNQPDASGFVFEGADGNMLTLTPRVVRLPMLAGHGLRAVYANPAGELVAAASDAALKTRIEPLAPADAAARIAKLRPVLFTWRDAARFGPQRELGFLAQDVQRSVPEVVGANADGSLSVDYPKLTAVLAAGLQHQAEQLLVLQWLVAMIAGAVIATCAALYRGRR